ncbi:FecR family protein [Peristeroidobacter soli]|jgi:transmembrane sensor|uniref:FecR family protein n=1 Tax=Peristeroidobacter soli TaxID=2497877 RepID=UPI00101C9940|nr:FecR domain-containing protein [Peristeroidobacter soli]
MIEQTGADQDRAHLAAAEWLLKLQDADVPVEEVMAWQRWVQADPKNLAAFERMQEMTLQLRALQTPARAGRLEMALDSYDGSVPVSQWRPRRHVIFAAAAALLISVVIAWQATTLQRGPVDVLATAVAENRIVTLADGSTVTLGGKTQLEVAFDPNERLVTLSNGEALFRVARDAQRPFKVRAGDATVIALGTEFNVRHGERQIVVSVLEGKVRVEPTPGIVPLAIRRPFQPALKPVQVTAGEQSIATDASIGDAERLTDPASVVSWQKGRLAFRRQPLRTVLEDVNRYTPKPIVPADDTVGALRITGTVDGNNVTGWLASLENVFELQAVEDADRIVLRRSETPRHR